MRRSMRSSSAFLPSPVIEQRGSRRVQGFICCSVLLALAVIVRSPLSWLPQVLAVLLVLVSGGREFYRAWPGSRGYLCQLQVTRDGRLLCGLGQNPRVLVPATVLHWWTLGGWVAGLVVHGEGGQRGHAILFRDQLRPDQWRQLNLCLRLGRA